MNKKDFAASIVFLTLAVTIYTYASSFPIKDGVSIAMNSAFYPQFISAILALLSILLMIESIKQKTPPDSEPVKDKKPLYKTRGGFNLLLTIIMLVSYPFLLSFLGFATAAFIFIVVMIIVLTEDFKKKIPFIVGLSFLLTAIMYCVFKIFLHIPFPQGILI